MVKNLLIFIENLLQKRTEASTEEIQQILDEEKFVKNFLSILSKTEKKETIEAILSFFIISLQISPSLESLYLDSQILFETTLNHLKDMENKESKIFIF